MGLRGSWSWGSGFARAGIWILALIVSIQFCSVACCVRLGPGPKDLETRQAADEGNEESRDPYEQGITLSVEQEEKIRALAQLLAAQGRRVEAAVLLVRLLRLGPAADRETQERLRQLLAVVAVEADRGKVLEALDRLRASALDELIIAAIAAARVTILCLEWTALCQHGGRVEADAVAEALKGACEELLDTSPDDAWGFWGLGELALAVGCVDEGMVLLERAIEHPGMMGEAFVTLAWVYALKGRLEEALLLVQKADWRGLFVFEDESIIRQATIVRDELVLLGRGAYPAGVPNGSLLAHRGHFYRVEGSLKVFNVHTGRWVSIVAPEDGGLGSPVLADSLVCALLRDESRHSGGTTGALKLAVVDLVNPINLRVVGDISGNSSLGSEPWVWADSSRVYLRLYDRRVFKLWAHDVVTGQKLWEFSPPGSRAFPDRVAPAGDVVFLSVFEVSGTTEQVVLESCRVYALAARTGEVVWEFAPAHGVDDLAYCPGGGLFATAMGGWVYRLDEHNGKLIWQRNLGDAEKEDAHLVITSAVGDAIYLGTTYWVSAGGTFSGDPSVGCVYAVRKDTGEPLWKVKTDGELHFPGFVHGGLLYIRSWHKDVLYLVETRDGRVVDELWDCPGMPVLVGDEVYVAGEGLWRLVRRQ